MIRTLASILLLAFLVSSSPALADRYDKAKELLEQGELDKAVRLLVKLAEQGDPRAQFEMGRIVEDGRAADVVPASVYFRKAAEQGHAEARVALAELMMGGVTGTREEAADWYLEAAKQGNTDACRELGRLYYRGRVVPRDHAEAARWLRPCAEGGDVACQSLLGSMYARGEGVEKDESAAVDWLSQAVTARDHDAELELARLYLGGRGVERNVQEALRLLGLAAPLRDDAAHELARLHFEGELVPRDLDEALELVLLAPANELAPELLRSIVRELDDEGRSAGLSKVRALFDLGQYDRAAHGVQPFAARGMPAGQLLLGRMQALAYGLPQDLVQAHQRLAVASAEASEDDRLLFGRVSAAFSPAEREALARSIEGREPEHRLPEPRMRRLPSSPEGASDPVRLRMTAIHFPARAERLDKDGYVVLQARITAEGAVAEPFVLRSSEPGVGFEEAAMASVTTWKYRPAMRAGQAVEVEFMILVRFER